MNTRSSTPHTLSCTRTVVEGLSMADAAHPVTVNTDDLERDDQTVHRQVKVVARFHMPRTREFAAEACRAVGRLY